MDTKLDYYTYKLLNEIYDESFSKLKAGEKLTQLEIELAKTAGHAVDFVDLAKSVNIPLNFSLSKTKYSNKTGMAAVAAYKHFIKRNQGSKELSKAQLAKKMAAYLYFTFLNDIGGTEDEDWHLEPGIINNGTLGYLAKDRNGNEVGQINLLKGLQRVIIEELKDSNELSVKGLPIPKSAEGVIAFGMPPVFRYVTDQVHRLEESIEKSLKA